MPGLLGLSFRDLLIRIFALTLSLSFHEFAHAWSAQRLGDPTAAEQGRLNLNPLSHLDPMGTLAILVAGIGWAKPVPVNPARFRRDVTVKRGMFLTAIAGPVANLILATIAMVLMQTLIFGHNLALIKGHALSSGVIFATTLELLSVLIAMNIGLAFFNLLPVPPLDGSRIFGAVLPQKYYYGIMRYERYIGMAFLFLFIFGRGFIGQIINFLSLPFRWLITVPLSQFFDFLLKLLA